MNQSVKNILSQVYELEGLLLLVENHAHNTDPYVYELIRQKVAEIATFSNELSPEMYRNDAEKAQDADAASQKMPQYECLGADSCCDNNDYEEEPIEMLEPKEVETIPESIEEADEEYPIEVEDNEEGFEEYAFDDEDTSLHDNLDEMPKEIWSSDFVEPEKFLDDIEDDTVDIEDEEVYEEDIEAVEDDDDTTYSFSEDDSTIEEDEDAEIESAIEEAVEDSDEDIITVDTAILRSISKNLRQAFTLNDRFRYRRELFGNSDVEMTNTINLVEAMNSYAEAEEYFYGDLEWDKKSPEVVDFMKIIHNHFA